VSKTENVPIHHEFESEIHDGLCKLLEVSTYLSFPFTLQEAADYFIPKSNVTSTQLQTLLSSDQFADLKFILKDGYLFTNPEQTIAARFDRQYISAAKFESAASIGNLLARVCPFIRTIAVTGSVAYGSADKWDDIDLFVITEKDRLWTSAAVMLAQVRLYKVLGLRAPHLTLYCLSYIHDEKGFSNESRKNQTNPLFARELLKAKPVVGAEAYRKILEDNPWVGKFYAAPYCAKLMELGGELDGGARHRIGSSLVPSLFLLWAERMAYEFLSRYLRIRAYLTNLKLKSQGNDFRTFDPITSPRSCVYTSNFYRWLSELWSH
jgi:predicted nucleotidyltransferase